MPHLGKYVPDWAINEVKTYLGPNIKKFKAMRSNSGVDVDDIFTNDFLDSLFFPDVDRSTNQMTSNNNNYTYNGCSNLMNNNILYASLVTFIVLLYK